MSMFHEVSLADGRSMVEKFYLDDDMILTLFATNIFFDRVTHYSFEEESELSLRQQKVLERKVSKITRHLSAERFNVPQVNVLLNMLGQHVVELRNMFPIRESQADGAVIALALYFFTRGIFTARSPMMIRAAERDAALHDAVQADH